MFSVETLQQWKLKKSALLAAIKLHNDALQKLSEARKVWSKSI